MLPNKRSLIWSWTCLPAILLLFTVSYAGKDASVISVGGGTICVDTPRFALCTSAPCRIDTSDPNHAICDCVVESGPNWGKSSCKDRMPRGNKLRSAFSPLQAGPPHNLKGLICRKNNWASCLDAPCIADPSDPTKAMCKCSIATTTPWHTFGGNCDQAACDQLWSAGNLVDASYQKVLDAFGRLGVPGADYPMCDGK